MSHPRRWLFCCGYAGGELAFFLGRRPLLARPDRGELLPSIAAERCDIIAMKEGPGLLPVLRAVPREGRANDRRVAHPRQCCRRFRCEQRRGSMVKWKVHTWPL